MQHAASNKLIRHMHRTAQYILLFKGAVGGSFAILTLLGVSLPYFGLDLTPAKEAAAASIGGVVGALVALRA